ncbi:MAG: bifunctional phosphoribosylaminoimidazolecarboxamide formyltransferase/IMP cyclohydrolase [Bacteroidetes bacterium]|nr:bifunctional phosphoribosylaminoimidazolecarboxamide formyltransferase/IMP cyclohydrolase [Bacteroidota bacterium]
MAQASGAPTALLSVFYKDGLDTLAQCLVDQGYKLLSTGGTRKHLEDLGHEVEAVEDLTSYPSILGGRVKTLHPKVFGGILGRRSLEKDQEEMAEFGLPSIDVVVVDLYPFEETIASGASHEEIIEKIDIGGISLIRAAAKNYKDSWIIPSREYYGQAIEVLKSNGLNEAVRKNFAAAAFRISSAYDTHIQAYLSGQYQNLILGEENGLRYGENPHQKGSFFGDMNEVFEKLHGKALSYNNLLDADAAVNLIREFNETTVAVLKHNNACGLASRDNVLESWKDALAGDPVSAFGGVLISNREIDAATAEEMHKIFFEIVMAPSYSAEALEILQQKKNRIILILKDFEMPKMQYRTLLNGILAQEKDHHTDAASDLKIATKAQPSDAEIEDLLFASKICKHTKSNTIILAKNKQLIAGGTGQTSRVDALRQSISKAKAFKFDLEGAVMASDAFFPFPDCVEIAHDDGIKAVIQPGGSIKDQLSIDYCDANNMKMVFTGIRHFKH